MIACAEVLRVVKGFIEVLLSPFNRLTPARLKVFVHIPELIPINKFITKHHETKNAENPFFGFLMLREVFKVHTATQTYGYEFL